MGATKKAIRAFQKSTVFEKIPKHQETVAEGNVFATRRRRRQLRTSLISITTITAAPTSPRFV
jgi:hypothetical protein